MRPGFETAEYNWGNALSEEGNFPAAVNHYERAVRLKPSYPEAEFKWANALANTNQLPAAVEHYRRALALRPDYAEAKAKSGFRLFQRRASC